MLFPAFGRKRYSAIDPNYMKECYLYGSPLRRLADPATDKKIVQCKVCHHHCLIAPGKRGICGVRENRNGKLYLLVYGKAIAAHIDPIEKKPLYHFLPGTLIYSIATVGCNLRCLWCQNADISQASKINGYYISLDKIAQQELSPQKIIAEAKKFKCPAIAYTYTEPTIFLEYALDTMKIAKKAGLKNVWVTNGYMSKETLDLISPYLDAANVDLKAFREEIYVKFCGAKLKPVLENIEEMYKRKIHLEVTTLIIPGVNDDEEQLTGIARFLAGISPNIPWHISRFFPAYKMLDTPVTPLATLKKAELIGQKAGLKYIYLGNM